MKLLIREDSRASLRRVYTPFILAAAAENAPHSGVIWKLHVGCATVRSECGPVQLPFHLWRNAWGIQFNTLRDY